MSRRDDETAFHFAPEDSALPKPRRRWGLWALAGLCAASLAGLAAYVYRNPLAAPRWLQEARLLPNPPSTVVYKWRDRSGAWHITDAPPEGLAYERLEYHRDTNVLPLPPQLQPKD